MTPRPVDDSLKNDDDGHPNKHHCITFDDVQSAARRIKGLAHETPVLTCSTLDAMCCDDDADTDDKNNINNSNSNPKKRRLFFKVEAFQRTGSFKFRGALNAVLSLCEQQQQQPQEHQQQQKQQKETTGREGTTRIINVVTHSSGNHAAALSLAAKIASSSSSSSSSSSATVPTNVHATIVMPRNAPAIKKSAVQGYGGQIVLVVNTNEARECKADEIVSERQAQFVHPSEDPRVIGGQGTVCLEFVKQVQDMLRGEEGDGNNNDDDDGSDSKSLDAVIIPVGGGGLASGNAVALRGLLGGKVKIILAEPTELDDAKRSFVSGQLQKHNPNNSLSSVADGLKTTLGPNTWPIIRDCVDDIITVTEKDILRATKLIWERLKVCIEPSSGVGVAVALGREFRDKYKVEDGIVNVGIVLCGGNVDVIKIARMMGDMGI